MGFQTSDSVSVDSSCTSGQIIKYDSATGKWNCITENIDVGLECPTGQIIKYDANRKGGLFTTYTNNDNRKL